MGVRKGARPVPLPPTKGADIHEIHLYRQKSEHSQSCAHLCGEEDRQIRPLLPDRARDLHRLQRGKGRNNLEVTIRSGSTVIRVAESTSDMFVSIDAAVASIERQLRKNKTRLEKRLRKDAFDAYPEESYFIPESDEEEEPSYQLVRTKRFFFRP